MTSRTSDGRWVLENVKEIDRVLHRLCTGPGHDESTWLPETEKYFYIINRKGEKPTFHYRCRLCANWNKLKSPGESGWISVAIASPFYIELMHRVGLVEAARRSGIHRTQYSKVVNAQVQRVQKRKLRGVMLALISARRNNEVRHRHSIRTGAHLRGWAEKPILDRRDLYKSHGDDETETKRKQRAAGLTN